MEINKSFIRLKKEDRELLKKFFSDNMEFIANNSFIEYENIKIFGDLYEQFIDDNNLRENDILMLFLAEIRYDQLAFKITENTAKMKVAKLEVPKNKLNSTISKWYHESKVTYYVSSTNLNSSIKSKIRQNEHERLKSIDEAEKYVVR